MALVSLTNALDMHTCWSRSGLGQWTPNRSPHNSYMVFNDPAGKRNIEFRYKVQVGHRHFPPNVRCDSPKDPACHDTPDAYEWLPANGSGLGSITRVTRHNWCRRLLRQKISSIAIIGDSVAWAMFQSLWYQLMIVDSNGPPTHRPPARDLVVPCGRVDRITLMWRGADSLNASLVVETVRKADFTVLNAGAWYSPHYVSKLSRSTEYSKVSRGASDSSAWRLFVEHLAAVQRALLDNKLPDLSHRLAWRTLHAGHFECDQHHAPLSSASEALVGLLRCGSRCTDEHGWHLFTAYDGAAREMLEPLGVLTLDVHTMSVLRPDAHTQRRYSERPREPDCMHLALPGVPDWWGALLLATIDACGIHGNVVSDGFNLDGSQAQLQHPRSRTFTSLG